HAKALASHNWEDARLADLYSVQIDFKNSKFLHLIFGTPFQGFRTKIYNEIGHKPDRSTYYLGEKQAPRLDLANGEIGGLPAFNVGRKIHQLIEILLRDFYHPLRIAGIFSELFPGEHFDVSSSPDRTHAV